MRATASTNPDLAPKGQERGDAWIDLSPFFSVTGTLGQRVRLSGGGNLGASLRLSLRDDDSFSVNLRPSGSLLGTIEVVDNFFFVDVRATVRSQIDNPFLATTDPTSPTNTSTSYQGEVTPYVRGRLPYDVQYELRSSNSWTDSPQTSGTYSGRHTAFFERAPQPFGSVLFLERFVQDSSREGQPRLITDAARLSLRYAPVSWLAVGARVGAERYNYIATARDWRRFYGAEASWRPNERTSLEGFWEDRVYGNSWQLAFNHRRPLSAFRVTSGRGISSTPTQFATFPGLANLVSLLDAAFSTRIPDQTQREQAIRDFLSQTQLPEELLAPTVVFDERITIETNTNASVVFFGKRRSLTFSAFSTRTEGVAGFSELLPVLADNRQVGAEVGFSYTLSPTVGSSTRASWRRTESLLDADGTYTTQTQLIAEITSTLAQRGRGGSSQALLGMRYQWITSTVTNDATEAAIYCALRYRFF